MIAAVVFCKLFRRSIWLFAVLFVFVAAAVGLLGFFCGVVVVAAVVVVVVVVVVVAVAVVVAVVVVVVVVVVVF